MPAAISQKDPYLNELRYTREMLRAEMNRALHWRRLVRARIDLSVATALLPEPLGRDVAGILPPEATAHLPEPAVLAQHVRGSSTTADVFHIGELREVELELAQYCDTVRRNLEYATDRLVFRLSRDPYSAIAQLTSAP